ncbi:hypothetical protein [Halosimplex halophilum]|uniref:hypothetical protein n=1 Tax=Halosimplex halophilum TaxID=2559572 RepID=UPI00107F83FF|nr:hypothetical protein [Halosimplex halophilum]
MDSASPVTAGIGQKTSSDAAGVATKASAEFFTWDWNFGVKSTSTFGAKRRPAVARRRPYRRSDHPLATGDGHA